MPHEHGGHPARTIAVPVLANATPEPQLGEIVTEQVKSEMLAAGPWRILNTGQEPQLLLNGNVSRLKETPVAFDADNLATEYQMEIHVDFTLVRSADGSTIWSAPDLIGLADYYVDKNSISLSRESKVRAFHQAGQRLGQSIVQQLELVPDATAAPSSTSGGSATGAGAAGGPPASPPVTAPGAE